MCGVLLWGGFGALPLLRPHLFLRWLSIVVSLRQRARGRGKIHSMALIDEAETMGIGSVWPLQRRIRRLVLQVGFRTVETQQACQQIFNDCQGRPAPSARGDECGWFAVAFRACPPGPRVEARTSRAPRLTLVHIADPTTACPVA